jgi:hypothetical protein
VKTRVVVKPPRKKKTVKAQDRFRAIQAAHIRETGRKDLSWTDMRMFFRSTDWAGLWEEWFLSILPNGRYRYYTIKAFAAEKAESLEQYRFLKWYLGPDTEEPPAWKGIHAKPQGWVEKRRTGGWFAPENLQKFEVEIRRRVNALDALREAGSITLHSLVRAEQMAQQIDRAFHGQMFADGQEFKANLQRAQSYIRLQERVQNLKANAQEMYAKSHGVNFDDMSGLVALMSAAAMSGAARVEGPTREEAAVAAVVRMAMAKASMYNLEIPGEAVEVMGEEAGKQEVKQTNRKKLN